jgi:hypothetical protein
VGLLLYPNYLNALRLFVIIIIILCIAIDIKRATNIFVHSRFWRSPECIIRSGNEQCRGGGSGRSIIE